MTASDVNNSQTSTCTVTLMHTSSCAACFVSLPHYAPAVLCGSQAVLIAGFVGSNLVETEAEVTARTTFFITERIPHWVWITGYIVFGVFAIGLVPQVTTPALFLLSKRHYAIPMRVLCTPLPLAASRTAIWNC